MQLGRRDTNEQALRSESLGATGFASAFPGSNRTLTKPVASWVEEEHWQSQWHPVQSRKNAALRKKMPTVKPGRNTTHPCHMIEPAPPDKKLTVSSAEGRLSCYADFLESTMKRHSPQHFASDWNRCCRRAIQTCRLAVVACCLAFIATGNASAQRLEALPEAMDEVGIDEHLETNLPLDLTFRDDSGQPVALRTFFTGSRPVILTLNYSDCPMLCQVQLNGLVESLRDVNLSAGKDFQVISVSINPLETPERARLTKQRYVKAYDRPNTAAGWQFLTGDPESIRELADCVGFRYKYLPERNEYVHTAALILCTPDGRIARYLYGVEYDPQTLKLSLLETSEGKIGTTLDRVLLFCFHYDAASGRYGPVAIRLMQIAGGITLGILLIGLVPTWLRRQHSIARVTNETNSNTSITNDSESTQS